MSSTTPSNAPEPESNPLKRAPSKAEASQGYLLLYNALSATLWATIFARVAVVGLSSHPQYIMETMGSFVTWTQTLALLEIGHSLFGVVRAPLFTTLLQVSSRILLVHGIWRFYPAVPSSTIATTTMLLAWSATESIRYSYFFAQQLASLDRTDNDTSSSSSRAAGPPQWLTWLRYNTFFVLYPLGISSECWQIWRSVPLAERYHGREAAYALYAVLAGYVPGAVVLYSHMMRQRGKVMRKQRAAAGKVEKKRQ